MAKKYSGEVCLQTNSRRITLRLEIGAIQELEDYFQLSILDILLKKFNDRTPKTDELLMVYAAMTNRDINDGPSLITACSELTDEIGVASALVGVKECLWSSVVSKAKGIPDDNTAGKHQAVQKTLNPLSRNNHHREPSWAQKLLQKT